MTAPPCTHPRTFFWALAVFPNGTYGCDACMECGAGHPPYHKGSPVPVPGGWRAIPAESGGLGRTIRGDAIPSL